VGALLPKSVGEKGTEQIDRQFICDPLDTTGLLDTLLENCPGLGRPVACVSTYLSEVSGQISG
jgi:hypothetical protein